MPKALNNLLANAGHLLDDIFAFISAPRCPGCDEFLENPRLPLCQSCEQDLNYPGDGPVCLLCRSPLSVPCQCSVDRSFNIPQFYYWSPYSEAIRSLIHQFKFERRVQLGRYLMGKALEKIHYRLLQAEFDIIIPVPMLKHDKKKRTFNQTELMAAMLAKELNRPYDFDSLLKIKPTRLQADLGRDERWLNIRGAFRVIQPERVTDKSILLVDDIVTTGATSMEASKALYDAGVKNITVFAIASSH